MSRRLELQALLEELPGLAIDPLTGHAAVYFQPPTTAQMVYPCIRYSREPDAPTRADNGAYLDNNRYSVTVIDPDPDTELPTLLLHAFQMCGPDRNYTSDNLNHYVFTLYY